MRVQKELNSATRVHEKIIKNHRIFQNHRISQKGNQSSQRCMKTPASGFMMDIDVRRHVSGSFDVFIQRTLEKEQSGRIMAGMRIMEAEVCFNS